jgi:hypothetical protein
MRELREGGIEDLLARFADGGRYGLAGAVVE